MAGCVREIRSGGGEGRGRPQQSRNKGGGTGELVGWLVRGGETSGESRRRAEWDE
jgi:hypothetical protein